VNDSEARRRLLWLVAIGGALVCAIVFVSLAAPKAPASEGPDLQPALASGQADATDPAGTVETDTGTSRPGFSLGLGGAASLAWRLGLVAVVMGGAIVGLRWWARKSGAPSSTTGFLRVLDTLAISNGRTIHLVALGKRVIVVGATAQQLGFLNELSEDESREVLAHSEPQAGISLSGFTSELLQSFNRQSARSREHADIHETLVAEER
jgi:flagellar biogenesis protein FliO